MLGKDDLCSILVSTLVANDLFLTGHKILRKGMTRTPLSSKDGEMQCQRAAPASEMPLGDGQVTRASNAQQFTD